MPLPARTGWDGPMPGVPWQLRGAAGNTAHGIGSIVRPR